MLILASASPRRRELIGAMGIRDFLVRPSDHEGAFDPALPPEKAVEKIALGKARDVAATASAEDIVVAADTLVFLDGKPLGKPKDETDAKRMLTALSGREHTVITGLAVIAHGREETQSAATAVTFAALTAEEIGAYVRTGEPMDKAGAYGIQGMGGMLVEGIRGDWSNVVGLPVRTLALMLARAGYSVWKGQGT